jgi:WG containing repeat
MKKVASIFTLMLGCAGYSQAQEAYTVIDNNTQGINTTLNNKTKKVGFTRFWALKKDEANPIIPYMYDWSSGFGELYATVNKGGKWGVIDTTGATVIPISYDQIFSFNNANMAVVSNNGKFGMINKQGVIKIPLEYDYISPLISDINTFEAVKNEKWGVINTSNKVIVPFEYFIGKMQIEGTYIAITENKKASYFLPSGTLLTMQNVVEVATLGRGYYKIRTKDGNVGVINDAQEIIMPFEKNRITPLIEKECLITVRKDNKRGVYSLKAKKWLIEPADINIYQRYQGRVFTTETKTTSEDEEAVVTFYDTTGKQLWGKTFEDTDLIDAGGDYAGLFLLKSKGKWGVLNYAGQQIIPFEIESKEDIRKYINDCFAVKKSTGWGIIDVKGKTIIPFQYYETSGFNNPFSFYDSKNYFAVRKGGKSGIINKKGETVLPFEYNEYKLHIVTDHPIKKIEYTFASAQKSNKMSVIDLTNNNTIVEYTLDSDDSEFGIQARTSITADKLHPYITGIDKKGEESGIFLINEKKLYSSPDFSYEYYFADSKSFIIKKNNKSFALADLTGKPITDFQYEKISDAGEGLFFAVRNNKAGFIDGSGKTAVPFKYDVKRNDLGEVSNEGHFYNGYAEVTKNGGAAAVTKNGEEVLISSYKLPNDGEFFNMDFGKTFVLEAYTATERKFLFKNKMYESKPNLTFDGSLRYQEPKFSGATSVDFYFHHGLEALQHNGLYGFVNFDGVEVIPFQYEMASRFTMLGYAYVKKDGEYFLIDVKGKRLPMTDLYLELYKEAASKK